MNVALSTPWTVERFLDWAGARDEPYEFDGTRPVAMTGGNANHSLVNGNLLAALRGRLRGTAWSYYGEFGLQTVGNAVLYPDGLVTGTPFPGTDRLAPGVVVVFEVVSPTSGRIDRVTKRREYAAVVSIRRYVIIETSGPRVTLLHRKASDEDWAEADVEVVELPEIGVCIPVSEFYEDVVFASVSP